jgi:hypothetical protein
MLTFFNGWIKNIVLVDPYNDIANPFAGGNDDESATAAGCWGSEEATQFLLNNLFYLTAKLSNAHHNEIGELWKSLATSNAANLPIILHYIFITMQLSLDNVLELVSGTF